MPKPSPTPETRAAFVDALSKGGTIRIAAGISRIPLRTAENWLRRGREQLSEWADKVEALENGAEPPPVPEPYAAFWLDCAEAIAKRDLGWIGKLQTAERKTDDWSRYAWLLERTAPFEFGLRETTRRDPMGGGGATITISEGATLGAVAAILQAAGKGTGHPVVDQLQDREDSPRKALPAAREILAEPADGEPAADSVPAP